METKYKILIGAGLGLFIALIAWVISTTPNEPPPSEKFAPPSNMTYEKNNIVEEKNGVKLFELDSDKMIVDAATQNAELEGVHAKFYQEDGKFVELTAQRGSYEHTSGNIHVEGEVVVIDSEGAKLISGQLDWRGKEEILIATEKVQISKDDMRAYGDRAEARNGLRHFNLKGNAHILKGVKDTEGKQ